MDGELFVRWEMGVPQTGRAEAARGGEWHFKVRPTARGARWLWEVRHSERLWGCLHAALCDVYGGGCRTRNERRRP